MSEQAVTADDPNSDTPNEGAEDKDRAGDARDEDLDLDALLEQSHAEGDSEPKEPSKPEDSPDVNKRLDALEKENADLRMGRAQESADTAINEAAADIKTLSSDLENVDPRQIKANLYLLAEENKGFLKIFANRDTNPKAWNDLKRATAKRLGKDLGGGSDDLTAGVDAATAAVKGMSHKAATSDTDKPTDPELRDKTNAEFEEYKVGLRKAEAAGAAR